MINGIPTQRLSKAENFLVGHREWSNEAYAMASRYEAKGTLGRLIMRITTRGEGVTKLEVGRALHSTRNFRESSIRAHNEEVIASWSD